jgi:hypothetical protein
MGKYSSGGKGLGNTVDNVTDINFGSSGNIGKGRSPPSTYFPDMNSSAFKAKVKNFSSKTIGQFKDVFKKLQDKFSSSGKMSRADAEDSRAIAKSAGDRIKSGSHPSELIPDASKADIDAKMNDPAVKEAANVKKTELTKLGLKGAAGVAFLMVLTKKNNPIDAINLFLDKTSEAFKAILKGLEKILKFFSNYGVYMSLCCCCLLFLLFATSVLKN